MRLLAQVVTLSSLLLSMACQRKVEPINYGKDQCDYCRMNISDGNYGAEILTEKGRIYKYDAIECMVMHAEEEGFKNASFYAVPFDRPKTLKPVDSLSFIISKAYRSPMGANLAAFFHEENIENDSLHQYTLKWRALHKKLSK